MLCGGEALPRALADRLLDKGAALWNVYGPTETTVWSSAWRVEAGRGADLDRAADRQHAALRPRQAAPGRPGRRDRRALHRRRRAGARLSGSPRPDGRAVHPRPVRNAAGRSTLPDRRPRPMAARRDARMPGAGRPPGQDPRLPRRAGRDRGRPGAAPGGARGGRRGPSGSERRDEPGRVHRPARRPGSEHRGRAATMAPGHASRVHGPLGVRESSTRCR